MTSYTSTVTVESVIYPGVRFTIRRISFRERLELLKRLQPLAAKQEFAAAGSTVSDRISAGIFATEIDKMYLDWGLLSVQGIRVDEEEPCEPSSFVARGPEDLCGEILSHIRRQCGLSDDERKN